MKNRFEFQPRYFLLWLVFFVAARALFLLYYASQAVDLPLASLLGTFGYGLRLDASATAYVCAFPFLVFVFGSLLGPRFPLGPVLRGYTYIIGVIIALFTVADLELYRAWGFRLDATPLQYLHSPTEMAASAGNAPLGKLLLLFGVLLLLGWGLYRKLVGTLPLLPGGFGQIRAAFAALLYTALLAVPLRGGVQQIPVNQSDVYFSAQPFANHAALNVPWNVVNGLLLRGRTQRLRPYLPDSTATRLVQQLYARPTPTTSPAADSTSWLLREARPNVLFIILESFTAKLVGSVGGEVGVTPNLDSLARTGVLFPNIYAAGDRSERGLVALLSGYPNQPRTSIIKYAHKTDSLPHLCRSLEAAGYRSSYYYGGELAFANMQAYLRTAGYDQLTERSDFAARDQNSKWGAHDHVLFDRILRDLRQPAAAPFFVTAFTLSSHEPFEVPMATRFKGTDEPALFRNSVYYTDWALGRFLRQARQQPWWAHTLVVLVADHGHTLPGYTSIENPDKFHIPLLLAGGALRPAVRGRVVATLGSQTDVAATLLAQLNLPTAPYQWSRNLLQAAPTPFAFYCFNNGFGMVGPHGAVTYDNVARHEIWRDTTVSDAQLRNGQAYQQKSLADFEAR